MPIPGTTDGVAAEMERIFKPLAGRAIVPAFHHGTDDRRSRVRRGRRRILLAATALVVLVAAVLATSYRLADGLAGRPAKIVSTVRLPQARVQAASAPPSTPSLTASMPAPATPIAASTSVAAAVSARDPVADPRSGRTDVALPATPDPVETLPARTSVPTPTVVARREPSPQPAEAKSVAPAPSRANPLLTVLRCMPDRLEDRCIYQDVLQADTNLRRVYDRAERDGVSKLWLSGIARRWTRARAEAEYDPDGAIRRYERLADALDEERRRVVR